MKHKILSILLTLTMTLTLLPVTAMAAVSNVASIDEVGYTTLATAIEAAKKDDTIVLNQDVTESVTVPADKNITLDLNDHTITNAGTGKVTLSVAGEATVKNGTINGGAGNYNIAVGTEATPGGKLTLSGVTATAGNSDSSMIDNWGTLTIESGTYTGGLNVVKNEPNTTLTISGGEFTLLKASSGFTGVIYSAGNLVIKDGTFKQSETTSKYGYAQVVYTFQDGDNTPSTEITGGTFINAHSKSTAWTIRSTNDATPHTQVTGGKFNKKVSPSYLPDGYAAVKKGSYYELGTAITGITLDKTEVRIKVGETIKLNVVSTTPKDAVIKDYSFQAKSGGSYVTVTAATGAVKGKAIGDAVVIAEPAGAGSTPAECTVHVYDEVAQIGETKYGTLEDAIAAAGSNDTNNTIVLLKDITISSTIAIANKALTIDMNEHKITGKDGSYGRRVFQVGNDGSLTLTGTGTITTGMRNTTSTTFPYNSSVISVDSQPSTEKGNAYLEIGENVTITAPASNGISVFGCNDDSAKPTIIVNGTVRTTKDKCAAVIGNGTYGTVDITVGNTATIFSTKSYAIYFPAAGNLTINGGTIKGLGGIECKAGATEITVSGNPVITATGTPKHEVNNNGSSTEGYAIAVVENKNYAGAARVSINSGYITGKLDIVSDTEVSADKKAALTITDGYFSEDPSTYVVEGKAALSGSYVYDGVTYGYKIGDPLPTNVEVVPGKTEVKVPDTMNKEDADKIAGSSIDNVSETANEVASNLKDESKATTEKLNEKLPEAATKADMSTTITTVVAPRLDIEVQSYDKETKTLTLDVEAVYDIKATTNTSNMKELNADKTNAAEVNTVTLQERAGTLDTTGIPVTVRLALPDCFAAKGNTLYVTHTKKSGAKYVHQVTVQQDNNGLYVEFVNDKGFSTFSISAVVAASITENGETTYYETLQDAVDAVENGNTIKVLINGQTATVSGRSVNFTVDHNDLTYTINLGSYCTNNSKTENEFDVVYSRPFSGGSSSSSTTYTITVDKAKNGEVTSSHKSAAKGTTVTLTVSPDKGYTLETLSVLDKGGKEIKLTEKNGKYSFTMPTSKVEVKATFMEDNTMLSYFVDAPASAYYYDAVLWAAEQGITGGTDATHFSPDGVCTRAQAVTFLWRAAGSPVVNYAMNMSDVPEGAYYTEAVRWALSEGITVGTRSTTFSPDLNCSRAQIVTFLWRFEKSPAAGSMNPFTDISVGDYYADAVLWAVKENVTAGTSAATFSPDADCTRAQIVTFIYRALAE